MDQWRLEWQRNDLWAVVNQSGETATNVSLAARGPVVIHGKRDWRHQEDQVADGDGIQFVGRTAWGAAADPPTIQVHWLPADGDADRWQLQTLQFPT